MTPLSVWVSPVLGGGSHPHHCTLTTTSHCHPRWAQPSLPKALPVLSQGVPGVPRPFLPRNLLSSHPSCPTPLHSIAVLQPMGRICPCQPLRPFLQLVETPLRNSLALSLLTAPRRAGAALVRRYMWCKLSYPFLRNELLSSHQMGFVWPLDTL